MLDALEPPTRYERLEGWGIFVVLLGAGSWQLLKGAKRLVTRWTK